MEYSSPQPKSDFSKKLKWLMFFRALFGILMLGSTIALRFGKNISLTSDPFLFIYVLVISITLLTIVYSIAFYRYKNALMFGYLQLAIDTVIVTLIIFITGSFSSAFTFLYLVVIMCASMLLFRKGSMIMAVLCSIQYGILVDLEYYGILIPFGMHDELIATNYDWGFVLYKMIAVMVACFLIAFLSSVLAEQERKTRYELEAMEENIKRVEKMAAIGEMAAGLAHEIKNPLASLSGSIQLLMSDEKNRNRHDKLMQIILREADRLNSLVNEFLLFAKPQQGNIETLSLVKFLPEIISLLQKDRTCRNRISFSTDISPDATLKMDSGHLNQILWNLLLNAVQSIEEEGTVHIKAYLPDRRHTCIKITDNGCGIPADKIKSIFDPFFTTKQKGSGLGLSIVHRIMEAYSGQIDVVSEIGKGTEITLKFYQP